MNPSFRCSEWQTIPIPEPGQCRCFEYQAIHTEHSSGVSGREEGFVSNHNGQLAVWRNHCPHAGSPLDWVPGIIFSEDGQHLICHTHFAVFDPISGDCLDGPCSRGLYPLPFSLDQTEDGLITVPLRLIYVSTPTPAE